MKLQDQVTDLRKAKRLKELGISQDSLWFWEEMTEPIPEGCAKNRLQAYSNGGHPIPNSFIADIFSAFTIAELGCMLPDQVAITRKIAGWRVNFDPASWSGSGGENVTLADLLASLLISLLEQKFITAEEANARLSK
jgi:hypothetical protein